MRWFWLFSLFVGFSSEAHALTYDLPISGSFVVDGLYTVDANGIPNLVTISIGAVGGFTSITPSPGQYYGASLFVEATTGATTVGYGYCAGNEGGGPCDAYTELLDRGLLGSASRANEYLAVT
jgi:hypothetical protein